MKAYQLTIELVGIDPPVWRRVIIPADVTFRRLHDTIQTAMGWHGNPGHPEHEHGSCPTVGMDRKPLL